MATTKSPKRDIRPARHAWGDTAGASALGVLSHAARPLSYVRLTIGFGIVVSGMLILALHGASLP